MSDTLDVIRAISELKAEKEAGQNNYKLSPEARLKVVLKEKTDLEAQVSNLRGQNKSMLSKLADSGKGADYPSCWFDSDGGIEFIYNATLTNDGIVLEDNEIPHRHDEQSRLPISKVKYNEKITKSEFIRETLPLKKWAEDNKCHFFVRLYDETDGDKKLLYKSLRSGVEYIFYISVT